MSGGGARRICAMQHKCVGRLFNRQIAAPDMQNEHDRLTTYADVAGLLLLILSSRPQMLFSGHDVEERRGSHQAPVGEAGESVGVASRFRGFSFNLA